VATLSTNFKDLFRMIVSTNVSNFVKKICRVLTILRSYANLSVGVSLILGHGVNVVVAPVTVSEYVSV